MLSKDTALPLFQTALDALERSRQWADQAFIRAQAIGLQGEKRRERHNARKDYMLIQHLRCLALDLFNTEIEPVKASGKVAASTIPEYFREYLGKLVESYNELHQVANDMVVSGLRPASSPIYKLCDCLWDQIIECRRAIKEGELAKWEYHHISRYQVSFCNVHDKMEETEESEGYKFN